MAVHLPSGVRAGVIRLKYRMAAIPNKRELGSFVRHYVVTFLIFGVFASYLSTYYSLQGIPTSQIGLLMAIGPLASLLLQPLWGYVSDRAPDRIKVLRLIPLGSAITAMLFLISGSFWGLVISSVLYMSFSTAMIPLSDAYTVNYLTQNGQKYSYIRLCGSTAFAVAAILSGFLLSNDTLWLMFPYTAVLFLVVFANMGTLPRMPLERSDQPKSFRAVLKDPTLVLILIFIFFMQVTLSFNMSFLGVYVKDLGFSDRSRGLIFSMVALSEVPVLLLIDRAIRRFPIFGILVFSGFLMGIRYLIYAFLPTPGFVFLAQTLNGLTFMPVTYSAITYINNRMPMEYKTSGQSLLAFVQAGAGNITGSILGGVLSDRFGIGRSYFIFALVAFAATIALFLFTVWSRKVRLNPSVPR